MTITFNGHVKAIKTAPIDKVEVTIQMPMDPTDGREFVVVIPRKDAQHWLPGREVSFTIYALPDGVRVDRGQHSMDPQQAREIAAGSPVASHERGVKTDRVACPDHRAIGPIPTCHKCREQAQPHPACRFNGYSTRSCKLGTLGCVIDHKDVAGVPAAPKTVDAAQQQGKGGKA